MYSGSAAAMVFVMCLLLESGTYSVSGNCDPGESNYTTIVTVNNTKRVPGIETKTVKTKSCAFFRWFCDTRYKAEYYYVMKYTLVQDKINKEECCPGYSVANSSLCIQSGCLNGTYGDNCTQECSCTENAYNNCDQETGNCTCLPGWHDTNCTEICNPGHYGEECQSKCECEDRATCDPHTGQCTCPPGWDGHFCEKACANETYGYSCNETCRCYPNQMCDHVTGNCDMCKPGIRNPPDCDTVCTQGSFGQNCSRNCSCDTNNTWYCHEVTGKCICNSGYRGIDCKRECLPGTYGFECSKRCEDNCTSGFCNHVNGSCYKCYGKTGPNCSEECTGDTFGFDCLSQCQCNSYHSNGTCDSCSGACHCHTGRTGYTCDRECPAYMADTHCQSMVLDNHCEPYNITWSCSDGWTGKYCDKVVCDAGRHGNNCSSNCTCNSNQDCNPVTGQCTCKPGYTRDDCNAVCPLGTYGFKCAFNCTCNKNEQCHPVNGSCDCMFGWEGDNCTTAFHATQDDEAVGMLVYIFAAGGVVLLAACVLAAVVCLTRRKRRKTNKIVLRANHADNKTQTLEQHTMNDLIDSGSAKGNTELVKQIHDGACKETGRLVIADNTKPDTQSVKIESLYEVATADTTGHLHDGLEINGDENQKHDETPTRTFTLVDDDARVGQAAGNTILEVEPEELLHAVATRVATEPFYDGLNRDEYVNIENKDNEHTYQCNIYENLILK